MAAKTLLVPFSKETATNFTPLCFITGSSSKYLKRFSNEIIFIELATLFISNTYDSNNPKLYFRYIHDF